MFQRCSLAPLTVLCTPLVALVAIWGPLESLAASRLHVGPYVLLGIDLTNPYDLFGLTIRIF